MADPDNFPLSIETPAGAITELGTRRNLRTLLEYLEGWLRGRGAKGIDSMAGRPGARPALMENIATARISTAQTAQRLLHESVCADSGRRHSAALVKSILGEERADIIARLGDLSEPQIRARYECAFGIAQRLDQELYGTGFSQPRLIHPRRTGSDRLRFRRSVGLGRCSRKPPCSLSRLPTPNPLPGQRLSIFASSGRKSPRPGGRGRREAPGEGP